MLDDLIELVLEILLDGAMEAAESKRVPMPARIALGAGVALFFLAVVGLVFWTGVGTGNWGLIALALVLFAFFAVIIWRRVKDFRAEKRRRPSRRLSQDRVRSGPPDPRGLSVQPAPPGPPARPGLPDPSAPPAQVLKTPAPLFPASPMRWEPWCTMTGASIRSPAPIPPVHRAPLRTTAW